MDVVPAVPWLAITEGIIRGNEESFRVFYEQHFDLMFVEARRLLKADENTCLDIVHDAMLKAMRSMRPIADPAALGQWARLIVRTTTIDWLRKRLRRRETGSLADEDPRATSTEALSESRLDAEARLAWIDSQLQELEPSLRQMLELRYRWGWTLRRIAERFGIRTGTADGRIRRAVERLRRESGLHFPETNENRQ